MVCRFSQIKRDDKEMLTSGMESRAPVLIHWAGHMINKKTERKGTSASISVIQWKKPACR